LQLNVNKSLQLPVAVFFADADSILQMAEIVLAIMLYFCNLKPELSLTYYF